MEIITQGEINFSIGIKTIKVAIQISELAEQIMKGDFETIRIHHHCDDSSYTVTIDARPFGGGMPNEEFMQKLVYRFNQYIDKVNISNFDSYIIFKIEK